MATDWDQKSDEGFDAFCAGLPRSACPYAPATAEYQAWTSGWDDAEAVDFEDPVDWSWQDSLGKGS
jgi:ribosome modulation factor